MIKNNILLISLFSALLVACSGERSGETVEAPVDQAPEMETSAPIKEGEAAETMREDLQFSTLIEPGAAGEVEIGQTLEEIQDIFGVDAVEVITLMQEGTEFDAWNILSEDGETIIQAWPDCGEGTCKVDRLLIFGEDYETSAGISVGQTFGDIKAAHGELDIFVGLEGIMVYTKELQKLAYVLETDMGAFEPDMELQPDQVLNETKIIQIYTF